MVKKVKLPPFLIKYDAMKTYPLHHGMKTYEN